MSASSLGMARILTMIFFRNGWGATAVDALSTALVMELKDIALEIVDYIATIDYTHTASSVSLFETNVSFIRASTLRAFR